MRQLIYILVLGLLLSSCKKSTPSPISVNDGTYVGEVTMLPSTNYIMLATFEVKAISYTKMKLLFRNGNIVAEADLNGSNFTIIPTNFKINDGQTEYQGIITGEGSFGKNTITLRWHEESLSVKNSYSEYSGTLTKF
ncbi:MAG: hypothetical protein PSX81_14450 [bacterium]|nr:hypothetical protein [bacterium]